MNSRWAVLPSSDSCMQTIPPHADDPAPRPGREIDATVFTDQRRHTDEPRRRVTSQREVLLPQWRAIGRINQGVTHTPLAPDDPIS